MEAFVKWKGTMIFVSRHFGFMPNVFSKAESLYYIFPFSFYNSNLIL